MEEVSLYDLGYTSVDLHQFITLCEAIERNDKRILKGLNSRSPYFFTRDNPNLIKNKAHSNIIAVENGSIILIVEGFSQVARAGFSLLTKAINHYSKDKIRFEIACGDFKILELFEQYKQGYFGKGDLGFENFIHKLSNEGYDIRMNGETHQALRDVSDHYAKRIVKTLNKSKLLHRFQRFS